MKLSSNLKILLKVLVSILLFSLIFMSVDINSVKSTLNTIDKRVIPLLIILILFNYIVSSMRWKKLIEVYGTNNLSVVWLLKLYFIGSFFNNFLPTSIGGDVYKAMRLGKVLGEQSKGFAATFMERFSGLVVLALFAGYGLVLTFGITGIGALVLLIVGAYLFYLLLSVVGVKVKQIGKFREALTLYRSRPDLIIFAVLTSVLVQVFSILTQHSIFGALGYPLPLLYSFFAFPVIIFASFVIPSQNSFGVQDALYAAFFSNVGIPLEVSVTASLVYHFVRLLVSLVGGVFYAMEK